RYMLPYAKWYAAGTLCLWLTNWIAVTIPLYVAEGIDALAKGPAGRDTALSSALVVAVLGVIVIGIRTASRLLFFTPGRLVEAEVKHDVFARILAHQPSTLDRFATGDLISRVSNDAGMVRMLAGFASLGVVNTVAALTLTGSQMVRISPTLAALAALPLLGSFLVIQVFMTQLHRITRAMQDLSGELSEAALSSYQGVATIQAFGAGPAFEARFEEKNQAFLKVVLQRANVRTVFGPILSLGAAVNVFLLLRYGGPQAITGELSVGDLVAFMTLVAYLTGPMRGMSFIFALVKQSQASLERLEEVLDVPLDRPDLPDPAPPPGEAPAIEVHGLTFTYPGETSPTLRDISFSLPAGGTLGVVGPTGSGKTTLLRVLARLYDPPADAIRIDGTCVRCIDLDGWREAMTLVPQKSYLFSESLADNILLGGPRGGLDALVALAALDVDVAALPEGVETQVGEAGVTLSGGQRQRTALARGLARPGRVLMLDDVLSAVDHKTEQQLVDVLRSRSPRPTTVLVAHRLSALQHADLILVLDGGRVVDSGTHAELLARDGIYRDTWLHQTESEGGGHG
ncbi:MAG: ABC transporter ATP-binding protein, partial [Myxococcales bacterium]|nr:ABC transporter ATP-binding protein [Myxococcales bacterium]